MKRSLLTLFILFCFLITGGCAVLVVGAGAGAGVYTYMSGQLKRTYQVPFARTNQACFTTLENLKISITEKSSDEVKATIRAKRTDGTPVTVKTVMIAPGITEVSVRSGIVGMWDKKGSELIHASIAQRLQG